jgi:hypothetical protein
MASKLSVDGRVTFRAETHQVMDVIAQRLTFLDGASALHLLDMMDY